MRELVRELSDAEIAHFREHGWLFAPALVDPQSAAQLAPDADRIVRASKYKSVTGYVDAAIKQHHDPGLQLPLAREIALAPAAGRNWARLLRGAPRSRLLQSNFAVKYGVGDENENGVTVYHQDYPGHAIDRSEMVTAWIALNDIGADMGPLRFVDGSHRCGSLGRTQLRPNDDNFSMHPWLAELPLTAPRAMRPGDATLHHGLTVHGADKNATRGPRLAYQLIYIDAEALYSGARLNPRWDAFKLEPHKVLDNPQFPLLPVA